MDDGPVTSDEEVGELMLHREAWRSRIGMIVKENSSSNSGRCRTRSDFVIYCNLVGLQDILSRLVVVPIKRNSID
jgi:hypothetical protein